MVKRQNIRLTKHSIERIKERLGLDVSQELVNNAWLYGKTLKHLNGKTRDFILNKLGYETNGRYRITIYRDIVFIFTAQNPILITIYELPEELK